MVYNILLAGIVSDEAFHKCLACLKELEAKYAGSVFTQKLQFFPSQWEQYLKRVKTELRGEFQKHKGSPIVILNGNTYIGGVEAFMEWALNEFRYMDKTNHMIYRKQAYDCHKTIINESPGKSYVYMEINTGASLPSKVVIELFDEIAPKTCENFRQLCKGFQRLDDKTGEPAGDKISYVGTEFHRVVKGMYCQAGDISKVFPKLNKGFSIYDGEFADESFSVRHTEPGLLGMCKRNGIPDTNECQFYVTMEAPLYFLDGQTVIFGRVIEGFRVFNMIGKSDLLNEKPQPSVKIEKSGIYTIEKPDAKKK